MCCMKAPGAQTISGLVEFRCELVKRVVPRIATASGRGKQHLRFKSPLPLSTTSLAAVKSPSR